MTIPTFAGQPTRGETFAKLIHHLDEVRELCAVMSHLHRTEDNSIDALLAQGWLGMAELFLRIRQRVVEMGKGRLQ